MLPPLRLPRQDWELCEMFGGTKCVEIDYLTAHLLTRDRQGVRLLLRVQGIDGFDERVILSSVLE